MATWLCVGGSRLRTPDGAVAVERLLPGTVLATEDGGTAAVGAVGRIRLSVAALLARPALWPVRIAAGALGPGVPDGDVVVLADQALAVAGCAAVAAKWLVNGTTLCRPVPQAPLEVFSLALPAAPAGVFCVPDGAQQQGRPDEAMLRSLRRRLADGAAGGLAGSLDEVGARRVAGWADDGSGRPVALELEVDGVAAPPLVAGLARADLAAAGIGDGRRGFALALEPALDPRRRHQLRLRRAVDGADLPGSPALLDAAAAIGAVLAALPGDAAARAAVEAACRVVAGRLEERSKEDVLF